MVLSPFDGLNSDLRALEALAEYLQTESDVRSRILARQLHDDLGGSLVAAMMDVAWLTRHTAAPREDISAKLHRIDGSLTKAIELMRRLVDELQPALIDSIGLFVAVSAHFGRECRRSGVRYSEVVAGVAPHMDSATALTVFRIAQGFLQWIREDAGATDLYAYYEGDAEELTMRFVARGIAVAKLPRPGVIAPRLASVALRLRKVNGTLDSQTSEGGVTLLVRVPAHASHPQIAA
jgi:signal transduction histidine kinase